MTTSEDYLLYFVTFLFAATLFVPFFKKFGLGTVLGYLAGGSLVGPFGLNLVPNSEVFNKISEFGIIMLLFIIGLELQPKKIWSMRKSLLGLGSLQILFCTVVISAVLTLFLKTQTALVIGFALSLSSTAFVLQTLSERKMLDTSVGRHSFSILLMQDLVAIPSLALIPLLALRNTNSIEPTKELNWLLIFAVIILLIVSSKYFINFIFRFIATTRNRELFTAVTLLIVLGVSWIMGYAGLSMALGAFFAGVLLSESEYNHELEANLMPFRGLLMGFFFIYVGMGVNYSLLKSSPFTILVYTFLYLLVKLIFIYIACFLFKEKSSVARKISVYLSQGGEFAFVIFTTALNSSLISKELSDTLTLIVTLSMIMCPLLIYAEEKYSTNVQKQKTAIDYDEFTENHSTTAIIAGFGRFGQIIGRMLKAQNISFTAIDHDSEHIEFVRKFGNKVYYGDASRVDLLQSAGAERAKFIVIAVDNMETSLEIAKTIQAHYPKLKIYARARNRLHAFELLDLKITSIRRETFDSSLRMASDILIDQGYAADKVKQIVERFQNHDEHMLLSQHKVRHDEQKLLSVSKIGAEQLAQVLEEDQTQSYIKLEQN